MDNLSLIFSAEYRASNPHPGNMLIALMVLGALLLAVWTVKFLGFIARNTLRCQKNIYGLYGLEDTWAVVTGGSDGIGEQFCHQLARQGFNICIVARNKAKMIEKLEEIKRESGRDIKTKYIVADFSEMTKYADYEYIAEELKGIDVGMLVLNAGWAVMGHFQILEPVEIQTMINTEAIHPVYTLKAMLS